MASTDNNYEGRPTLVTKKQIKKYLIDEIEILEVPKRKTIEWFQWLKKYEFVDLGDRVWCAGIRTYYRGEKYYVLIEGDLYGFFKDEI